MKTSRRMTKNTLEPLATDYKFMSFEDTFAGPRPTRMTKRRRKEVPDQKRSEGNLFAKVRRLPRAPVQC